MIGDFNEITTLEEKRGGNGRSFRLMENFRVALEDNGLSDLGWKGRKYIWSNQHGDESCTKERLDKVMANSAWQENFGNKEVEVLISGRSDHTNILRSNHASPFNFGRNNIIFRFEVHWTLDKRASSL